MTKFKVLVTGINGFVGTYLKDYFDGQVELVGVSRKGNPSKGIKHYDELLLEDFDSSKAIIHLAAIAHDLKNFTNEQEYYRVNLDLTKILFDKFLKSNCEVFIFMSSVKSVADSTMDILTEEVRPNPLTHYGKSKLAAEQYIQSKELPGHKRLYILRPCMIHGPNNKGNLNLLYKFVQKGIPYPLGNYKNKRSFLSIHNLAFIIHELIINDSVPSGIYNVSDDDAISTNEIVEIIGKVCEKEVRFLKTPKFIMNILARIGDNIPFPLNTEKLQKLTSNFVVSNVKIKNAIKKELPLTAKEGLKRTIQSL